MTLISPEDVERSGKRKYNQNLKVRRYLKGRADPEEVDRQFHDLHEYYFSQYDCSTCRNCCKKMNGSFNDTEEKEIAAKSFGVNIKEFEHTYLAPNEFGIVADCKSLNCDFLMEEGSCRLGEAKPEGCKTFPPADKPDRVTSMWSIIDNTLFCPIVYELRI